jgi:hypothetical protein
MKISSNSLPGPRIKATVIDQQARDYYALVQGAAFGEAVILDSLRGPLPWPLAPDRLEERVGYLVSLDGDEMEIGPGSDRPVIGQEAGNKEQGSGQPD